MMRINFHKEHNALTRRKQSLRLPSPIGRGVGRGVFDPKILTHEAGVSLIEFAFVLPLLVLFIIGTLEFSRYALLHIKLDKTASAMADFLTQREIARYSDMDAYGRAASEIMKPFVYENGSVIFSAVTFRAESGPPCKGLNISCISWQYRPIGGEWSRIGRPGQKAEFPNGYKVLPGQIAVVAEAFAGYKPMLNITGTLIKALAPQTVYKYAIYKPRQLGGLVDPPL